METTEALKCIAEAETAEEMRGGEKDGERVENPN